MLEEADAEIDVMTDHANNLRSALLANRIDLYVGMCNHLEGDAAFAIDEVFRDAFTGVCLRGHPLTGRRVAAAEVAGYEWVVPQLDESVRAALEAFFVGHGLARPRFRVSTNADPVMAACLRDGRMLSVAPVAAVGRGWLADLAPFTLVGFSGERRVGLVRRAGMLAHPLQDRFAAILRRHVRAAGPPG
nr:LysR substrate-binding domain-containing protein [Rubellimicrobium sp. CFH 75288]